MSTIKRYKKQCSVAVMFIIFGMVLICFHNPVRAKQAIKLKTKNMVLVSGESKKLKINSEYENPALAGGICDTGQSVCTVFSGKN